MEKRTKIVCTIGPASRKSAPAASRYMATSRFMMRPPTSFALKAM
jgi:pyruvate kinase